MTMLKRISFTSIAMLMHGVAVNAFYSYAQLPAMQVTVMRAKSASFTDESSPLSSSTSSLTSETTVRPASALPRRVKSKKKKASSSSKNKNGSSVKAISSQEVADHVSHMYIHGPGGILSDKLRQSRHKRDSTFTTSSINSNNNNNHETSTLLHKLDRHPALVLNADYQPVSYLPLSLWHWQEAVKAIFSGKVTVVDVYPDVTIRAATLEIPLPSVIALNEYVPKFSASAQQQQKPAFTKRNVFLRDEYRCQYCNEHFHTRDLSLDHVVPRCNGGRLHWENVVTCCRSCNGRKGSLSVSELRSVGMKLLRRPVVPTQYELAMVAGRMLPRKVHPTWEPYLGLFQNNHHRRNTDVRQGEQEEQEEEEQEMMFMEDN